MKKIIILGSTGSVGVNALEVVRAHPDQFKVVGLAAHSNVDLIESQVNEFRPECITLTNPEANAEISKRVSSRTKILGGEGALSEMASWKEADLVIAASSGSSSLLPILEATKLGKNIAIANKEILVMAGRILMDEAKKSGSAMLPVDSEHNAIFQCLQNKGEAEGVKKILLTGSGGPLKNIPEDKFKNLTKEQVLNHPKWKMGEKITVDSATMMNKGLEIIEARWLFDLSPEQIEVLIHPQAIVHSMVEFCDGSVIAQLGVTDMKLPLIHTMAYPERLNHPSLTLGLDQFSSLTFERPDFSKFPCLQFAIRVAKEGDTTLSSVLNACDEIAVNAFLNGKIQFVDIPKVIESALSKHSSIKEPTLDQILEADRWAREISLKECGMAKNSQTVSK